MLGIILDQYDHLLERPCVIAAYAACGWLLAIAANCSTSLTHSRTMPVTYDSTKVRVCGVGLHCSPKMSLPFHGYLHISTMKQFSIPSCMFLLVNEPLLCGISMITKVWSNLLHFVLPMFKPIELVTSRGIISKPDLLT